MHVNIYGAFGKQPDIFVFFFQYSTAPLMLT